MPDWTESDQENMENSSDENTTETEQEDPGYEDDMLPLPEAKGTPENIIQNALAVVLLIALGLAGGNLIFKLLLVGIALISAALRYSVIGILVIFLLALFS